MIIWLILIVLSLACALYICGPLLGTDADIDRTEELRAYTAEIQSLESRDLSPALAARKVQLQRRVLAITDADSLPAAGKKLTGLALGVFAAVLLFTAGFYAKLGRPDLTGPRAPIAADEMQPTQEELAARMEGLLDADPNNRTGQILYARLLMNMGRFDQALMRYEKAQSLEQSAELTEEVDSARAFIAQARAAQSMPAEDRMSMISGMVDSLAARLADEPDNPEGWVRLLKSRRVLGQNEALAADIKTVQQVYKNRPELRDDILARSGADQ